MLVEGTGRQAGAKRCAKECACEGQDRTDRSELTSTSANHDPETAAIMLRQGMAKERTEIQLRKEFYCFYVSLQNLKFLEF